MGNVQPDQAGDKNGEVPEPVILHQETPSLVAPLGAKGIGSLAESDRRETPFHLRIRAVGRMALTNYLSQTVLGVVVLQVILDGADVSRLGIVIFVGAVWAVEIMWSKPWLDRFMFGPVEWLWRSLTYGKPQPFRQSEP